MATRRIEAQAWIADGVDRNPQRSSPLGWLSRMGINLLSFFSDVNDSAYTGSSGGGEANTYVADEPSGGGGVIVDDKCCFLARPDNECRYQGDKSNYTCPDGFQKTWWFCCEGTQQIGCGECSSGPTCWQGPWECSIFWYTGQTC